MMKLINKSNAKRFGILLIIVGAFIPSILYPFSSISFSASKLSALFASNGVQYDTKLKDLEIVLVYGDFIPNKTNTDAHIEGRLAIPYRYPLAFGILLAFIGIGIVALHKDRKETG